MSQQNEKPELSEVARKIIQHTQDIDRIVSKATREVAAISADVKLLLKQLKKKEE